MQTLEPKVTTAVRIRWIRQPGWDALMALEWLVGATLIFSVSHQPLQIPSSS